MAEFHTMTKVEVCKAALGHGIVKFSYRKKSDRSLRVAIGTRCPEIIAALGGTPKGERETKADMSDMLYAYYDLTTGGWRSFYKVLFEDMLFEDMSNEQASTEAVTIALKKGENINNCIQAVTQLIGGDKAKKILSYVSTHPNFNTPAYEEDMRISIFDGNETHVSHVESREVTSERHQHFESEPQVSRCDKPTTTQMSSKEDEKQRLIKRLMELRREEDEVLAKLLSL